MRNQTHLTYMDKNFRLNMQKFLVKLEPRFYEYGGDYI